MADGGDTLAMVRESGLFDPAWYARRNGLDGLSGEALLQHFVAHGAGSAAAPSPLFDPAFYAALVGMPIAGAFDHYLRVGSRLHLSPHPLFDAAFYYSQRPDVQAAGVEPLGHYLRHGATEGSNPNPFFDSAWYNERYVGGKMNPLIHYVLYGEVEGSPPSDRFDPAGYLRAYPDVAAAGESPLYHFLRYGEKDGRLPLPARIACSARERFRNGPLASISAVIPTYNRGELLDETVRQLAAHTAGVDVEFIIVNDGSNDATADVLRRLEQDVPNLRWREIPNGGPGGARNIGASLATKDVILFLGDDVQPLDDEFFRTHARLHAQYEGDQFAVLGKCVWPTNRETDVSFVMSHIQGKGGEQFGYSDLTPFSFVDWRFFYTANVSVKRKVVSDWTSDGFRPDFKLAAYEDGEFAYRLSQRPQGFMIFYDPTSNGRHIHPYTAEAFINRQLSAGMMAKVFVDMHGIGEMLSVADLVATLASPNGDPDDKLTSDYLAIIEGLKAWTRMLDRRGIMGREHWHNDLLFAIFYLSYQQGFVLAAGTAESNVTGAYSKMIQDFLARMRGVIHHEIAPHEFIQRGLGLQA